MKTTKRLLTLLMALLLIATIFTGCAKEKSDWETIQEKGKLVVGITDWAPMDFKDENGEWTGFDAELARMVGNALGLEVEFMEIDWNSKIMELNGGMVDCVWNGMTLTDEVLSAMECTKPYVLNSQVVVMKAENASQYSEAADIAELSIAVEAGSAGASAAADCELSNINEVALQSTALMEVAAGTSDACIVDKTMAAAMIGEGTSYEDLVVALVLTDEEYGIGFRKGSELAAKVNELLDEFRANGSLQALADKYGLSLANG